MKRLFTIIFILFVLSIVPTAQSSVIVDFEGTSYKVTTMTGTYISLQSELENQVWFTNSSPTAVFFAEAVDDALGTPNAGGFGAFFAAGYLAGDNEVISIACETVNPCMVSAPSLLDSESHTWAKASVVPLPAAAWLFMSGLIGLVWKGRKATA